MSPDSKSSSSLRASLKDQVSLAALITDYAAEGLFLLDDAGNTVFMNKAAGQILGFDPNELLGKNFHEKVHYKYPDGRPFPISECPLQQVFVRGEVLKNHEDVFFRKDGTPVSVACSNVAIIEAGHVIAAVLLVHELTESKRIESALAESESKFRAVADTAPCAIYIHDARNFLYVNSAAEKISGYTSHELIGLDIWQLVHPEDRDRVLERALKRFAGEATPDRYEYRIVRKDGGFRWVDFSGSMVQFGNNRAILGTAFDITEKKSAQEALRLSEERFRMMAEQSPLSVQILSPDGRTLRVNPAWEKMFGVTLEMLGDYNILEDQQLVDRGIMPCIQRAFAGEACMIPTIPYVPDRGLFMGQKRYMRAFIYPVMVNGLIHEIVLSHEDVTEQKLAEETLRKTEKLAAAGRLAATVAHEINNPLESVTNLIFLARQSMGPDELHRYLALADEELARVSHIAKQTLGFYRESTKPADCDLAKITEDVLNLYRYEARAKRIHIESDLKAAHVFGFSGELKQVISNLLRNALEATPTSGKVVLRTGPRGKGACFSIADTGAGIPEEAHGKIFEPFFTTKKDVGTGLGLWVSKEIVEKHGGSLEFRTSQQAGKSGTSFEFTLTGIERKEL